MRHTRSHPANGTRYQGVWFGPSHLESLLTRALDVMTTRGATSAASGLRVGDTGSRLNGWAYGGDCGPLQSFRGAAGFVGASPVGWGVRPGFNIVLPGTTGLPSDVQDLLPGNPA